MAGKVQWHNGIPPVEVVAVHESQHPRPDGIRLGDVCVDRSRGNKSDNRRISTDDWSYGEWVCYHHKSRLQPYVSIVRLKVVEGEVLFGVGFTAWTPLSMMPWASECRFYPVDQDGLPFYYDDGEGA